MADRYTKAVLTVIAVALIWIAASLTSVPKANAALQNRVQQVEIVGVGGRRVEVSNPTSTSRPIGAIPVLAVGAVH
jgi:hypothetical protein